MCALPAMAPQQAVRSKCACRARQVGECDVVLEAGAKALEKWEARSMRRDILLAMALAHLGLASDALEAKEQARLYACMHAQPLCGWQDTALSTPSRRPINELYRPC